MLTLDEAKSVLEPLARISFASTSLHNLIDCEDCRYFDRAESWSDYSLPNFADFILNFGAGERSAKCTQHFIEAAERLLADDQAMYGRYIATQLNRGVSYRKVSVKW